MVYNSQGALQVNGDVTIGSEPNVRWIQIKNNPRGSEHIPTGQSYKNGASGARGFSIWTNGYGVGAGSDNGTVLEFDGRNTFLNQNGGNVTIGTVVSKAKLNIASPDIATVPSPGSSSNIQFLLSNSDGSGYGMLSGTLTTGHSYIQSQRVDGSAVMYPLQLQPNGSNVLIGTAVDNGSMLQVNGAITAAGAIYPQTTGAGHIQSSTIVKIANGNSAQGMYINNLCVTGSWALADANVGGSGSIWASADMRATAFNVTSTRASKENIVDFTQNALNIINATKIVSFNYISDEEKSPKIGFIADDTDKLLSGQKNNSMDLANTIGLLIKAVQELTAKIEILENK